MRRSGLSDEVLRVRGLSVRLTRAERARLEAVADAEATTLSEAARRLLRQALGGAGVNDGH